VSEAVRRHRVTAVLVRGPGLPAGDVRAGLEMEVALDPSGELHILPDSTWAGRIRRRWPGRPDWEGELVRLDDAWGVRGLVDGDNAPVWELQGRSLRPGDYLTLVRPNDAESVFRVVNVETL
jgi:hypothetical protein